GGAAAIVLRIVDQYMADRLRPLQQMCSRPKKRWITTSMLNASSGKAAKALPRSAPETTRQDRCPIPRDGVDRDRVSVCIPIRPCSAPTAPKNQAFSRLGASKLTGSTREVWLRSAPQRRILESEGYPPGICERQAPVAGKGE